MEEANGIINAPYSSRRKKIKIGCLAVNLTIANIFFAFFAIVGEVGQQVTLPLWIDSAPGESINFTANSSQQPDSIGTNNNGAYKPRVDAFFVYSFACISFVVLFGSALLFVRLFRPHQLGETEKNFPHRQLFLVGLFDALNGVLVVFASSGSRTAPYLQAILGNFLIPLTMLFRYLIIRKVPTLRKLLCALIVLLSLCICLIPKIFTTIDPKAKSTGGATGIGSFLWPLCYMLGFVPAAVMHVIEERGLKWEDTSERRVNMVFFYFWTSFYEMVVALSFFWTDYIPEFGYANNIYEFRDNWLFGFKCFFGGAGCNKDCAVRGITHITMHMVSHIAAGSLMRFSEGATLLAIVNAIVTPLVFIFWTVFRESPFGFHPAIHITTWFSIAGLVPMVPAIFVYNTGNEEDERAIVDSERTPLIRPKHGMIGYSFSISERPSTSRPQALSMSVERGPLTTFKPDV